MSDKNTENPVSRKLAQLGEKWWAFEQTSHAPLGVWKVRHDDSSMVDAFVRFEDTKAAVVPSIFFSFDYPFRSSETYAFDLIDDFLERINHPDSQKALQEANIPVQRLPLPQRRDRHSWLQLLSAFGRLIEHLEGSIVAYLTPKKNESPQAWVGWIADLLEEDIPSNVRLMLKQGPDSPSLDLLTEYFPDKVHLMETDIEVADLMQEVVDEAAKGRENTPEVLFQKAFIKIGQHGGKQEMGEAERYAGEALSIARAQNWPQMQVAVFMSLGGGYIGVKQFDKAIAAYQQGRGCAQAHAVEDPEMGHQLEVQLLFGIAGCYLGLQDFKTGGGYYLEAGPIADVAQKDFLSLEAWRMAGFCAERNKEYYEAWDYNQKALEAGRRMPEAVRRGSTLPFVGDALLRLAKKVGENDKKEAIDQDLAGLIGEDWQELAQIPQL